MDDILGEHPERRALGQADPCRCGVLADRALEASGPEPSEEPTVDRLALDDALGTEVAVGQDRGRPVAIDDLAQATGDLVERLIPADLRELACPFGTRSPQRVKDAVRAVARSR